MTDHTTPAPEGAPFSIGEVISQTLSIYSRNFVPFFLMAFVVNLPLLVYELYEVNGPQSPTPELSVTGMFGSLIIVVLNLVVTGAILYGVHQQMRGEPFAMPRALEIAGSRLLTIAGVSIVSTIIVGAGFFLLVIPGIVLALMFAVAVPATVVEGLGPIEALRRSRELTSGHRLELLALAILLLIVMWLITMLSTSTLGMSLGQGKAWVVIWQAISVAARLLQSVGLGVLYYELRKSKEGIDLNDLTSVFE